MQFYTNQPFALSIAIMAATGLQQTSADFPITPHPEVNCESPFNLTLKAVGEPSKFDELFIKTAKRWNCIIRTYNISKIDGIGGMMGYAQPIKVDDDSHLPTLAYMNFDIEDMESSSATLEDTIIHEMGHAFGLGVLWNPSAFGWNLPSKTDVRTDLIKRGCPEAEENNKSMFSYLGKAAQQAFHAMGFISEDLTVENGYGLGSKCLHWDEEVMPFEIMSPIVNPGVVNIISNVTLASLVDLGWEVDFSKAEKMDIDNSGA
eukprot:Pgem_evm1s13606